MTRLPTELQDAVLFEMRAFGDNRGEFYEAWNHARYAEAGLDATFIQSNVSVSHRGVLRGLHAQCPNPQGKLISVPYGRIWDVIADVRPGSPTYMAWQGFELSSTNHRQLWIPPGFLHGFLSLEAATVVNYLVTAPYDPAGDLSVAWNDPELGIVWPLEEIGEPLLSGKDAAAPAFSLLGNHRLVPYN